MLESDADRLASIKGLGGQLVRSEQSEFWAIFENAYADALAGDRIETRVPTLTCRTSDVSALRKGASISITEGEFKVVRNEPDDPPGWTTLRLGK